MTIPRCLLALALLGGLLARAEAAPWVAGLHHMTLADPVDSRPMQALAFYPANGATRSSRIDGYPVEVAEEAPVAMGRFPLLVLSHGNNGSPLALHYLATSLARPGSVVVAVVHPGDNARDHSRLGTLSNLYGRPLQVSAAISAARDDAVVGPYLNEGKVGVIGYSAGGETALILSGARPDLDRLRQYCLERPNDADACRTHGILIADRSELAPEADPRVGAVMLMAPPMVTSPVLPPLTRTPVAPSAALSMSILDPASSFTSLLEFSVTAAPEVTVIEPPLASRTSSGAPLLAVAVLMGVVRPLEMTCSA